MSLSANPETNNQFARGGPGSAGFVAENHGSTDTDGLITFQLPLDVSLQKVQLVTAANWTTLSCPSTGSPGQYRCDVGMVPADLRGDRQINIDFLISPNAAIGPQIVTATLSSPAGPDPNPANNSASYTFLSTGTSHFKYALAGPVIPAGGSAQFVLTVQNVGPDPAAHITVVMTQPVSKHFTYAHPTFDFVSFGSPGVRPGGNSMDWLVPQTLQSGDQAKLTMTLRASGVDLVGTIRVFEYSDSAGNCGYSDCGTTFTLHATAQTTPTPSPSPPGPTLASTGSAGHTAAAIGIGAVGLGLLLLTTGRATGSARRRRRA